MAVKTADGITGWFKVLVSLCKRSMLSPLLFITVTEVISREIRGGLPWLLLYAHGLVLMVQTEDELWQKLPT